MKRILFITNSISFGGAAKMLCFVAESLADRGHIVTIVNLRATHGPNAYERTVKYNVELIALDEVPIGKNKNLYRIKEIAEDRNVDVIIGFVSYPNLYATMVGKLAGIPSIISERGDPSRNKKRGLKRKIFSFIINSADGGVFQTDYAKVYYKNKLKKKGVVIPNPIFINGDVPCVKNEEREKTIVSVGRLANPQKRLDVMLNAFEIFTRSHPEYVLKLYGKGPDEEKVRQWCVDLNIQDKVQFLGLTTQPMRDIAHDGMFLITSDYEGVSNSLLEAMAVGLPCVSTDHTPGGARFLIQDHKNGLLAPIGDDEAIAKAMCEFADDLELSSKCGENARDVIKRFEPNRIIDMWEDYIDTICKR